MRIITLALGCLLLGGCAGSKVLSKIDIPNCPQPYKLVQVINGTISGDDLQNLIDNTLDDRLCIARLKALLGDPEVQKKLKKLSPDTQQRVHDYLNHS